jgi:hypothetical protein
MAGQDSPEGNILLEIRAALFRPDSDYSSLIRGLRAHQKYLTLYGRASVSLTAINNWFKPGAGGPKRSEALQFLHSYLLASLAKAPPELDRSEVEGLAAKLAGMLAGLEGAAGDDAAGQALRRRESFKRWKASTDTIDRLAALQGTYQIIRPFVSRQDRYVLEAMAIDVHRDRRQVDLLMYSHNQPVDGFLYSGEILPSSRHCFGFVSRPDEMDPGQYTFRCITLNAPHRRLANGYEPKYCLSGLVMRGVKGAETIGIPSVCLPFVAIKAAQTSSEFHRPKFAELSHRLSRLNAESSVLVGQTEKEDGSLFEFCDQVFSRLGPTLSPGMIVRTVRPDVVEAAVVRNAKSKNDYFGAWKLAAESGLATHLSSNAKDSASQSE